MESQYIDVLNQIVWMHSPHEVIQSIINCGIGIVIGLVLWGVLQCFVGYKIYRIEVTLIGMVGGGVAMYGFGRLFAHLEGGELYFSIIAAAIIGGGMLYSVYAFTVFLFALACSTVGLVICNVNNDWKMLPQVILILAIAFSLICLVLYKHALIISKALIGSAIIGCMVGYLFNSSVFGFIVAVIFGMCGLGTQYWLLYRDRQKKKRKKRLEQLEKEQKKSSMGKEKTEESAEVKDTIVTQPEVQRERAIEGQKAQEIEVPSIIRVRAPHIEKTPEMKERELENRREEQKKAEYMSQVEMERAIRMLEMKEEERKKRMGQET